MQQTIILMIGGAGGAVGTFLLQKYGFTAITASCSIGLIGAFLGYLFSIQLLPPVIFAGSFVGMTALHLANIPLIFSSGLLVGYLFSISLNIFSGFGGRLGTLAFISVLIGMGIQKIIKK